MNVGDLLEALESGGGVALQGDVNAEYRGFVPRLNRALLPRRFFLLADDNWEPRWPRAFGLKGLSAEEAIKRAFDFGATGVVCSSSLRGSSVLRGRTVIFADDTLDVAYRLTRVVVDSLTRQRVTAVTGSAGKSTTKEMIAYSLRALDSGFVFSSNPLINRNLPVNVIEYLNRAHRHSHTVLEVAASWEYRRRGFAISPDVAVVTSIAPAHLEEFRDMRTLADVKADIFTSPRPGGTAVVNIDTEHAELLVDRAMREGYQLITYGESDSASIRLVEHDAVTGRTVAEVGREPLEYRVGAPGKHMALNSLAVIAVLRAHRHSRWRDGVRALDGFEALSGRGRETEAILDSGARITLIDEAFNANPASIRAALEMLTARNRQAGGRKIAVLGDSLELGEDADAIHRALAADLLRSDVDEVHLFGVHMAALFEEIRDRMPRARHWADAATMSKRLLPILRTGDIVLAKASGDTGLKAIVKTWGRGGR